MKSIILSICALVVLLAIGGAERVRAEELPSEDLIVDEYGLVIEDGCLVNASQAKTVDGVLTIPEGVTSISGGAFNEVWHVKKVILPKSIRTIERAAFDLCSFLNEIIIPEGLDCIEEGAFLGTALEYIVVPESLVTIEAGALSTGFNNSYPIDVYGKSGSAAEEYSKMNGNRFYSVDEYIIEEDVLVKYNGNASIVEIPARVSKIGEGAFAKNIGIEQIIFHEGITEIGEKAFQNCINLSQLDLPDSLTRIGYAAFDGCVKLEKLTLPVGIKTLHTNIFAEVESMQMNTPGPDYAFFHPSYIKELTIENNRFVIFTEEEPKSEWGDPMATWTECMTNLEVINGHYDCEAEDLAKKTGSKFVSLDEEYTQLSVNYSDQLNYRGDVDKNSYVDASDALEILRYVVALSENISPEDADLNGNDSVDAEDALIVLKYTVKLLETRLIKPRAYETHQFSVNGKFQGLTALPSDATRETMIIGNEEDLRSYLRMVYEKYTTEHNENEFVMMKKHFAMLDEEYFEENVCVVTVAAGALGAGTYGVCSFTNRDVVLNNRLQIKRGLVMNYYVGADENVIDDLNAYILVVGTTIPREAFENGELSYVTYRNVYGAN